MLDVLELQSWLESKAAKGYITSDITNVSFSMPVAVQATACFQLEGWPVCLGADCTRGGNTAPTICHGLQWKRMELQNSCSALMTTLYGMTQQKSWRKGIKSFRSSCERFLPQSRVRGAAQELELSGIKGQEEGGQIPGEVMSKTAAAYPPRSSKETQGLWGVVALWSHMSQTAAQL